MRVVGRQGASTAAAGVRGTALRRRRRSGRACQCRNDQIWRALTSTQNRQHGPASSRTTARRQRPESCVRCVSVIGCLGLVLPGHPALIAKFYGLRIKRAVYALREKALFYPLDSAIRISSPPSAPTHPLSDGLHLFRAVCFSPGKTRRIDPGFRAGSHRTRDHGIGRSPDENARRRHLRAA